MKNARKQWSSQELQDLKTLRLKGLSDVKIGNALGRSASAVQQKRSELKMIRKSSEGAKYTRYLKPSSEVSILWGLIKITKG